MTRIIVVSSGKGGVGKTTVVSNLSSALALLGKSVIAIDCNLTTSNLSLHLGIPFYPVTFQDVLHNRAHLDDAIYYHHGGFRVIPASISLKNSSVSRTERFLDIFYELTGSADFVIIDSAAGLGPEALSAVEAADEVITVTNPEMPAMVDARKLSRVADRFGTTSLGVILNRVSGERQEASLKEVEDFLNTPMLGIVHEDRAVRASIAKKEPVLIHKPRARASKDFMRIASLLVPPEAPTPYHLISPIHRFFGWLR